MAFFKLKNAVSYSLRSTYSGVFYTFRKGDVVRVDNQQDIVRFRGMRDVFVEVDQFGNEISLLAKEDKGTEQYSGPSPLSYERVDVVPLHVRKELEEIELERRLIEEQLKNKEEEQEEEHVEAQEEPQEEPKEEPDEPKEEPEEPKEEEKPKKKAKKKAVRKRKKKSAKQGKK